MKVVFSSGDAAALPLFKRAIEIDPKFAMAHAWMGRAYGDIEDPALSGESTSKAYRFRDRVSDAENFFITASYDLQVTGNLEKAQQTCEAWAQTYPREWMPHAFLGGIVYLVSGKYEKAVEEARKAVELDQDFAPGYAILAYRYQNLDRLGKAEDAFHRASERKLNIPDFLLQRYDIAFLRDDKAGMEREVALGQGESPAEDWISNQAAWAMTVFEIHKARYKAGRFFTDQESAHHAPVAVIGADVARHLLETADPIDKWILVDGHSMRVVGVMDPPAASMPGQQDLRVLVPYFTMRKMFPNLKEHMLVIVAYPGMIDQAVDQVRAVLRIERRVPYSSPDTFSISTSQSMIERFRQVTGVVALVMVVLSSIGLLVGGIGVMNIMLVSVTERTREIGIRKAVGARKSDIIVQFLTEAVVLTMLGGIFGLILGWLISRAAGLIFANLPTAVPLWTAVSSVLVSVGVGLFFGIWPAGRAARLDPVVALRYE